MVENSLLINDLSERETCSTLVKGTVYPVALRKVRLLFSKFKRMIRAKLMRCGLLINVTPTRRLTKEVDFLDGENHWVELKTLRVKTKELNMNV